MTKRSFSPRNLLRPCSAILVLRLNIEVQHGVICALDNQFQGLIGDDGADGAQMLRLSLRPGRDHPAGLDIGFECRLEDPPGAVRIAERCDGAQRLGAGRRLPRPDPKAGHTGGRQLRRRLRKLRHGQGIAAHRRIVAEELESLGIALPHGNEDEPIGDRRALDVFGETRDQGLGDGLMLGIGLIAALARAIQCEMQLGDIGWIQPLHGIDQCHVLLDFAHQFVELTAWGAVGRLLAVVLHRVQSHCALSGGNRHRHWISSAGTASRLSKVSTNQGTRYPRA